MCKNFSPGTYENKSKDGGSPDARLRFACLTLARLRLNDGAKVWVSFKLCFKTNDFYCTSARAILHHTDQKGPNTLTGSVDSH